MNIVFDLLSRAHDVSAVVKPRTAQKVYFHFLSELGELAEEANIAAGELYKDAGPDGVVGEAADVINCIADLLWITEPDKKALSGACSDIARLTGLEDFEIRSEWPDFAQAKNEFSFATGEIQILQEMSEGEASLDDESVRFLIATMIKAVMVFAKACDPKLTRDGFTEIYSAKCAKWREKAS